MTLAATNPAHIPGAVQCDLASSITGRTYRVSVSRPFGDPPPGGYPVLFVTDANLTFPIAAAMSTALMLSGGAALVVGVGYPADDPLTPMVLRTRDLTPPTPIEAIRAIPGLPAPAAENYGGAPLFARFLLEELRPAIAAAYPVNAVKQGLYGHSLGGLFTLSVLFAQPDAFASFIVSSPSIWWNDRAILLEEPAFAARVAAGETSPRVLITIGETEQTPTPPPPPGMTAEQHAELLAQARMVDNARELAARLAALDGRAPYVTRYQNFAAEDHMSVIAASLARALTFLLRA
jgi:predicted alpha/beta superfamily hydrolase